MERVIETIKKRYSCRTYDNKPIQSEQLKELDAYLMENVKGPFGNRVRFKIVNLETEAVDNLKDYISYGNVKGVHAFIAGCVTKGDYAMEDFGYCMEKNILKATDLGLCTVWLGGSLNRSTFATALGELENEVIPAITPIGYSTDKRTVIDKLTRTFSGGKYRKEFGDLFYYGDLKTPLDQNKSMQYFEVLEEVRWAPSASNKQPWRIIKDKDKIVFHFYMDEHFTNNALKEIKIQNNDMGIAMSHFELVANELGLQGSWHIGKPDIEVGKLVYIVSWIGSGGNND